MLLALHILLVAIVAGGVVLGAYFLRAPKVVYSASEVKSPGFAAQDYLPVNPFTRPGILLANVRGVVFCPSAEPGMSAGQIRDTFVTAESEERHESSHFAIGSDGEVIACVPCDEIAYASYDRSIDVISVTYSPWEGEPLPAQREAMVSLAKWLREEYRLSADAIIAKDELRVSSGGLTYENPTEFWNSFRAEVAG